MKKCGANSPRNLSKNYNLKQGKGVVIIVLRIQFFRNLEVSKVVCNMEYLYEYNAVIRYLDLPNKVKAFTIYDDENEFYNIYVNQKLDIFEKKKAIKHELEHIEKGHFKSTCEQNMNEIELGMSG